MSEFKPYKRGDVREDGKIFWGCNKANREGERWLTPEKFAALKLKTRARNAAIYLNNKEDICAARKVYYNENKERCIKRSSDTYAAICLRIEQDSEFRKEVSAKNSTRFKKRYAADPMYRLRVLVRGRVYKAIAACGYSKDSRTAELVGCDWETLRGHIEPQFVAGMSWENYGSEWHIDHITPLASATSEEELLALCHFTNLQPLWAKDNLSKGSKIPLNE